MIDQLEIAGCASYGDAVEKMCDLREINYVYGPNGAGKTTLSRLIADKSPYSRCAVHWQSGTRLETLVYNRDYIVRNFNEAGDLKGIFTLGEQSVDTLNRIAQVKLEVSEYTHTIEGRTRVLEGEDGAGGQRGKLAALEERFREACWEIKKKHDAKLQGALKGYRANKGTFSERMKEECRKTAPVKPPIQTTLETRAESLFGKTPTAEASLSNFESASFIAWESDPILTKRVIGKADVDIAAMILRLGNSDWVKLGIPYYEVNGGHCPFCQQSAAASLATSLEEYFDESFVQDSDAITAAKDGYLLAGERIAETISVALATGSRFLDIPKLEAEKHVFKARLQVNRQRLEQKIKEPSQAITLEPLRDVLETMQSVISTANRAIQDHNAMVENLGSQQNQLVRDVWSFFAHSEAVSDFTRYQQEKRGIEAAITSLQQQIAEAKTSRKTKEIELRNLERQTTSVRPTVDEINRLLHSLGFKNFTLKATENNLYQLCRPDGSDAKETLSEGERSFITFLYFYHSLRGSHSESGVSTDRVVVFDDPVSSLDSDVLFIVGTLIRKVIEDVREKCSHLRQIFILTHNVYFHKEVTFHKKRSGGQAFKEESFWILRKVSGVSTLKRYTENPIKTSYDLLWAEVRDNNPQSPSVQNAMRRILEHYFRILGGMPEEEIVDLFDGEEKLICKGLFSWVNDGSHSIPDDIFMTFDDSAVEKHKIVFKDIFVKTRQLNHYNMMMKEPYVIESIVALD